MKTFIATLALLLCAETAASHCVEVTPAVVQSTTPNVRIAVTLDGKPGENVKVEFYLVPGSPFTPDYAVKPPYTISTTNNLGIASVSALAEGSYHVVVKTDDAWADLYLTVSSTAKTEAAVFPMNLWSEHARHETPRDRELAESKPVSQHVRRFEGMIVDPSGGPLPGAKIRVFPKGGTADAVLLEINADAEGHFSAPLPPGIYIAFVFMRAFRSGVMVFEIKGTGEPKNLEAVLQVGGC